MNLKIGILVTSIGEYGKKGYYNSQELGLAKELDKFFEEVIIYKLIPIGESVFSKQLKGYDNLTLTNIPANKFGNNGFFDLSNMNTKLDLLVYFSDTQLMVPKVFKWCRKNKVELIPYIGVIESHSENTLTRKVMNFLFKRNLSVYKKCNCIAKTPTVNSQLERIGIKKTVLAPVGLDLKLLKANYREYSKDSLKAKFGYSKTDKILLFVGRLVKEKEPIRLIDIFEKIYIKDSSYKLLIVGNGYLKSEIESIIESKNLRKVVQIIERIENEKIWEIYRLSNCYINLNKHEIFGMALLEAMYYECKVVSFSAPGPNYIIKDKENGVICKSDTEIISAILGEFGNLERDAHEAINSNFTWGKAAKEIHLLSQKIKG